MSHDEHVDCSQALYRMSEYLDGEMTTEDAREIARHLTECAPCLEEHEREHTPMNLRNFNLLSKLLRKEAASWPAQRIP